MPETKQDHAVTSRVMRITPEQAAAWLETANVDNRSLREQRWMQYACDMIDGKWALNGEAIVFAKNGRLVDGQHRLKACVEAEVPFECIVVTGVEPSAFETIDCGLARTSSDAIRSLPNAVMIASTAKLAFIHDTFGIQRLTDPLCRPTRVQELDYIHQNEAALVAATTKVTSAVKKLCPPSVVAFCFFVFHRQSPELADRFACDLTSGLGLESTNPAYRLRERLAANQAGKAKLPRLHLIALFFRAWIAYKTNRPVRQLKAWRTDGPAAESFPDIGDVHGQPEVR